MSILKKKLNKFNLISFYKTATIETNISCPLKVYNKMEVLPC